MSILAKHNVQGMVAYKEAFEIPAFVVMEWINGPNLSQVVKAKQIKDWNAIIQIALELSTILETAHRLAERVLHRDLRPPNIMLKNYYDYPKAWEVVILDFDLSWHMGSQENSVINTTTATGYLAPEQLQKISGVSTRNAAIDSFGLGMTLFFIVAQRDPFPTEHKHRDWELSVKNSCHFFPSNKWSSIPSRFSRLILKTTKHNQNERWDMGQIKAELERLNECIFKPNDIGSSELWAEEIISRSDYKDYYEWEENSLSFVTKLNSGVIIRLWGDEPNKKIKLKLDWTSQGGVINKHLNKWLPEAAEKTQRQLFSNGWKNDKVLFSGKTINIESTIDVDFVRSNAQKVVKSINAIGSHLNFK